MQDPSSIPPANSVEELHAGKILEVVVETPRGSRNKYTFDHERRLIVLKKVLPAGMVFPFDFGFVPSTLAEDGDPIDVLLLMDDPTFPNCVVETRIIGVIEGEDQLEDGGARRNDRLIGVATAGHLYRELRSASELPPAMLEQMQEFFASYPRILSGKTYKLLGCKGPEEAIDLIQQAIERARK